MVLVLVSGHIITLTLILTCILYHRAVLGQDNSHNIINNFIKLLEGSIRTTKLFSTFLSSLPSSLHNNKNKEAQLSIANNKNHRTHSNRHKTILCRGGVIQQNNAIANS